MMIGIGFMSCEQRGAAIAMLCIGEGFSGFGTAGVLISIMEIAPRFGNEYELLPNSIHFYNAGYCYNSPALMCTHMHWHSFGLALTFTCAHLHSCSPELALACTHLNSHSHVRLHSHSIALSCTRTHLHSSTH